jgi:hypothetical protein
MYPYKVGHLISHDNWSQSKQPATRNRYGVYLQLGGGTFLSSNKQNAENIAQ